MGVLSRGCWIVVADAKGAMILENLGTLQEPDLRVIDRITAPTIPLAQAPREGHSPLEVGEISDMEVTNRALLAHIALSAMIVARLSREAARGMFQRFAIAAPPKVLAAIRDRLDDDLKRRLFLALPKGLIEEPLMTIGSVIQNELRRPA